MRDDFRYPASMSLFRAQWLYDVLLESYGTQGWWPGNDDPHVVCLGALLVQRTTWTNAANALRSLDAAGLMDLNALDACDIDALASCIRSVGFHNAKAQKLKAFTSFMLERWDGSYANARRAAPTTLRTELLAVHGIGPETADAMLTYAFEMPSFVIDAYTRRILTRMGWIDGRESYEVLQKRFEDALPSDRLLYAEFHALLVQHAKQHCRTAPKCQGCPTAAVCETVNARGVHE